METPAGPEPTPSIAVPPEAVRAPGLGGVSRRGFLRAAAVTGGGFVVAACAPATTPGWTLGPAAGESNAPSGSPSATASPVPSAEPTPAMSHTPTPTGSAQPEYAAHDANAKAVVKRYLDGEWQMEPYGNQPLDPTLVDGVKVYDMTIDKISHKIDALRDPLAGFGYNGTWPGPRLEVVEGDHVRVTFKNNLDESTSVHFHGQRLPNNMDGVPDVNQDPIKPGDSFTYEFVARSVGSHMYHSHHNATDQVGRGLLGAFIVQPKDPAERPAAKYGVSQDVIWISNDNLGGFTINGRGFPATRPIVATLGDKVLIRFMNEGNMMHPWHLHGMPMRVVARDGFNLGAAEFSCDTLGVNPGERYDVVITCDEPGVWAFHCHILQHVEGPDGMFGMVTALIVQEPAGRFAGGTAATAGPADRGAIARTVAAAAGSTSTLCKVPGVG
jgi:FtsP/CotA-like multicopper oxidase with cupredoxin domain